MRTWTAEELRRIGEAEELQVASRRAGGVERDVTFAKTARDANSGIDLAYHRKYDRHGPQIVGTVVGEHAWGTSIRLVPQES